jgi:XTP/dITP diphosphohydrolase
VSVRVVLASHNSNKARELERTLGWAIELLDAPTFPPETGESYYENARAKAEFGRELAGSDAWILGEDSGIEVAGLGGRPGIESARFGGDEPVRRLLAALAGVEPEGRRARYVCELVALSPDGREFRGTGILSGGIAPEPRGSEGFGYDPIFVPDGEDRTVAELGNEWKAENSHRAWAARALARAVVAASVSQRLQAKVREEFAAATAEQVLQRLAALDPPNAEKQSRERIQAATVLLAAGDRDKFEYYVRIANIDWRDVLVYSGLGTEDWPNRLDVALGR